MQSKNKPLSAEQARALATEHFMPPRVPSHAVATLVLLAALQGQPLYAQQYAQQTGQPAAPASACPAGFPAQPPGQPAAVADALAQMQGLEAACETRADFHAYRGTLHLLAGQVTQAANHLEKALLLNPDLPGAQLDYAQALARLGDKDAARQLVEQVAKRPDIDPGLRQWLQGGLADAPPDRPMPGWAWGQLLQTTAGYDTNLASTTHASAMTLYLSNGPVLVPLDAANRPQGGAALKNLLAVQGSRSLGLAELRLGLALQTRHTGADGMPHHQLSELSASYSRPAGPGNLQLRMDAHHYRQGDSFSYQDQGLLLKYEQPSRQHPCRWGAGLGSMAQQYPSSPNLDGHYHHVRLDGSCRHPDQSETQWALGTGQDRADSPLRPGGDKQRADWLVRHERPLGPGSAYGWLRQTRMNDRETYSPLTGNLISRTTRLDWGLGYWQPLRGQWSAGLDLESTSQKSSNTLLNIKKTAIHAGLRWTSR